MQNSYEMSFRGFMLGMVLALLFIAANIYLGLTAGITFSTSIPAAVISMALLSTVRNSNPLENNIVQTIASTGGTLSTIVFILPALAMTGIWAGFPFWQTTLITMIGGLFGILFTIPLRRALVIDSRLPYPEGTAAAEVLRVPQRQKEASQYETPLKDIILSSGIAFIFELFAQGFNVLSSSLKVYGKIGSSFVTGAGVDFSFALVGAGYLIGIRIGLTMLIGLLAAWLIGVPIFAIPGLATHTDFASYAHEVWQTKVRYVAVGVLGTASIWAIIQLAKPVINSIRFSLQTKHKHLSIASHEKDIPIFWVITLAILLIFPLISVLAYFVYTGNGHFSSGFAISAIIVCGLLAIVIGFIVASASGYMAGIVGSSNSPISGIGIIGIVIISLILAAMTNASNHSFDSVHLKYVIALAIFTTAAIIAMASISNDNLQDLQTGYLLKATPWKQQVALIFGVIVGSLIVSPVLNVLYHAYGFTGTLPHPGMDPTKALSAPQATLMNALAQGIIGKTIVWNYMLMGIGFGLILLIVNGLLCLKNIKPISIFSIGIGMYLPPETVAALFIGTFVSYCIYRQTKSNEFKLSMEKRGTLFACGLIVGDAVFIILLSILITTMGSQSPLSLVSASFKPIANILGIIAYLAILYYFYIYATRDISARKQGTRN